MAHADDIDIIEINIPALVLFSPDCIMKLVEGARNISAIEM